MSDQRRYASTCDLAEQDEAYEEGEDSAGVGRGWHVTNQLWAERRGREREREFFIDSLLVRVQHID